MLSKTAMPKFVSRKSCYSVPISRPALLGEDLKALQLFQRWHGWCTFICKLSLRMWMIYTFQLHACRWISSPQNAMFALIHLESRDWFDMMIPVNVDGIRFLFFFISFDLF